MGAGDVEQAEHYFHKLLKITLLLSVVWNTVVFALTPVIMPFFDVAPETRSLTVSLVLIHNIFNCVAFPFADPLGKGLRAAGDVKFTMVWSIVTTIGVRLLFSVLFAVVLDMGVTKQTNQAVNTQVPKLYSMPIQCIVQYLVFPFLIV